MNELNNCAEASNVSCYDELYYLGEVYSVLIEHGRTAFLPFVDAYTHGAIVKKGGRNEARTKSQTWRM